MWIKSKLGSNIEQIGGRWSPVALPSPLLTKLTQGRGEESQTGHVLQCEQPGQDLTGIRQMVEDRIS